MSTSSPEFWVLVAFVLFLGFGGRRIYVYITRLTDTYREQVVSQLEEATRLHDEAHSLLETYKAKHDTALTQAEDILAFAEKEIERFKVSSEQAYLAFKVQKEKLFQERLERDKQEILAKLRSETIQEAMKIIEKTLLADNKLQDKLAHEAIEEISQQDLHFKQLP